MLCAPIPDSLRSDSLIRTHDAINGMTRGADERARCRQVRAAHRFSADERRLDRLGIELI
jgi:hypothetical protein